VLVLDTGDGFDKKCRWYSLFEKELRKINLVFVFCLDEEIRSGDINSVFEGYSLYRNFENSIAYLARMLFSAFEIWIWNNTYKAGVFEISACVSIAVCPLISLKYWSLCICLVVRWVNAATRYSLGDLLLWKWEANNCSVKKNTHVLV